MVKCSYNSNHKVPEQTKSIHEKECFFKSLGYVKEDPLLPDSTNSSADNCIKFSKYTFYVHFPFEYVYGFG